MWNLWYILSDLLSKGEVGEGGGEWVISYRDNYEVSEKYSESHINICLEVSSKMS